MIDIKKKNKKNIVCTVIDDKVNKVRFSSGKAFKVVLSGVFKIYKSHPAWLACCLLFQFCPSGFFTSTRLSRVSWPCTPARLYGQWQHTTRVCRSRTLTGVRGILQEGKRRKTKSFFPSYWVQTRAQVVLASSIRDTYCPSWCKELGRVGGAFWVRLV